MKIAAESLLRVFCEMPTAPEAEAVCQRICDYFEV